MTRKQLAVLFVCNLAPFFVGNALGMPINPAADGMTVFRSFAFVLLAGRRERRRLVQSPLRCYPLSAACPHLRRQPFSPWK